MCDIIVFWSMIWPFVCQSYDWCTLFTIRGGSSVMKVYETKSSIMIRKIPSFCLKYVLFYSIVVAQLNDLRITLSKKSIAEWFKLVKLKWYFSLKFVSVMIKPMLERNKNAKFDTDLIDLGMFTHLSTTVLTLSMTIHNFILSFSSLCWWIPNNNITC